MKRKAEKEQQQEEHKKDLENKIIVKAKRIKKSQEKVLGNLDELKEDAGTKFPAQPPKRTIKRKQIIVYENDDTDDDSDSDYVEEKVVVKNKPKNKKQVVPVVPAYATTVEPVKPVYKQAVTFV